MTKYLSAEQAKNDMRRTMDGVEEAVGMHKRKADREAEAASESADWDLGRIAVNHPGEQVLIKQIRVLGPEEHAEVIQIHTDSQSKPPQHTVSHAG